ncbi:MAG: iron ABC transporter permease [Lentisphaerae bacterium]|nr:iron ABC transporter permease [Lentisphaerota bacterium]
MIFRRMMQYLLMLILVLFLLVFLILPLFTVIGEGCDWNLLMEVFRTPVYREGLLNSLAIALVTTMMVAILSLILAVIYDRYDFPGKEYCSLLMLLPMILPPFVGALGFQQILGYYGVVNTILTECGLPRVDFLGGEGKFWSVCVIEALHLYPVFYLNLITALGNIDPTLTDAAANLGASKLQRFIRIKLPLLKSGFLAGGSIVLVWSFTELGTPLMFGYNRVTPVQVFNGLMELENNPLPYSLVVVMLTVSALIYLLMRKIFGTPAGGAAVKGSMGSRAKKLGSWQKMLPVAAFLLVALLSVLPHLALVGVAFSRRWYNTVLPEVFTLSNFENALSNPLVVPSIVNSLRYSALAMVIAVVCGTLTALITSRWRLRGAWALDLLSMLPLAIPGLVIAFGFLGMTSSYAWARAIFNPVDNPLWLLAIAYAVRRIPYVVRAVASGLEQTPEELEHAARNFGAGPVKTLTSITFPLIGANLLVGGLFAFSFSMLEVSDSLILAQKSIFFPITKALLELSQILGAGPSSASAFGVWAMAFLALTMASAGILLGRKIGAIFKF